MILSVIIPAHNQAAQLQSHLPAILEQDFEDYEVIVVDMASTDETKDVLEQMELHYPQLHHTFTPSSARDISLERLAITLGLRAALGEWVIITHADCQPATPLWLTRVAEATQEQKPLIIGCAKYDERPRSWFDHKIGFFRLWNTLANLRHIRSGHAAVGADACHLILQRDLFMQQGGFGEQTTLLAGAEELLANRLSTAGNTAVLTAPEAIIVQDPPTALRLWKQQRTYYMETRRHQRHRFLYRTKQNLRMALPWLLLLVGAVAVALTTWPEFTAQLPFDVPGTDAQPQGTLPTALWIAIGCCGVLLLLLLILKTVSFNRAARAIGYQRRYILSLPLLALALPLWNASAWLSHHLAPRNEFRKKFV